MEIASPVFSDSDSFGLLACRLQLPSPCGTPSPPGRMRWMSHAHAALLTLLAVLVVPAPRGLAGVHAYAVGTYNGGVSSSHLSMYSMTIMIHTS